MDKARKDKVPVGLVGVETGYYLYNSMGFKTTVKVTITNLWPGKEASADFWVYKYKWNPTDNKSH